MMDTVLNIGLNEETVKGMIEATGDPRFVYDSYRRLIQMFGSVVMGVPDEPFEEVITDMPQEPGRQKRCRTRPPRTGRAVGERFKEIFRRHTRMDFPTDPL